MVILKTIEEMQDLLSEIAKNPASIVDIDLAEYRFQPEPIIIKIDGEGYDSSIDTEIMKHFVDIQELVYNYVKIAKYGNLKAKLKDEDKVGFKVMVQVKPGCAELITDLAKIMENLFTKMNGWQALGAVAVITAGVTIGAIFKAKFQNKTKAELKAIELEEKKEDHKFEVEMMQSLTKVVNSTLEKSHDIFSTFAEMNAIISIDNEELSKRELREISSEINR